MNFNQKKILFLVLFVFAATSVVVIKPTTLLVTYCIGVLASFVYSISCRTNYLKICLLSDVLRRGIALALCPAFPMIIKGVELTILHGIILSVFWMAYSLIVCSPLYYISLQASVFRK